MRHPRGWERVSRVLLLLAGAGGLWALPAQADCVQCSCTGKVYTSPTACEAECQVSLGCFVGICQPSDACVATPSPVDAPPGPPSCSGGTANAGAAGPLEVWRMYLSSDASLLAPPGSPEGELPIPLAEAPPSRRPC